MNPDIQKRISRIASDRESGASALLSAAVDVLRDAIAQEDNLTEVAGALRAAQPSMAGIWNATAAAIAGDLEWLAYRATRAPRVIARFAATLLETGLQPGAPLRLVTISYSSLVAQAVAALAEHRPVHVACGEGRPALEGRRLAEHLAATAASVTCYADAALADALPGADAVLVGADAVAPEWFINKSGTLMLAAAASFYGVPVYVLAGREKFVDEAAGLELRSGSSAEVWNPSPPGVDVRNPYFERIPVQLVAALISDGGVKPIS